MMTLWGWYLKSDLQFSLGCNTNSSQSEKSAPLARMHFLLENAQKGSL